MNRLGVARSVFRFFIATTAGRFRSVFRGFHIHPYVGDIGVVYTGKKTSSKKNSVGVLVFSLLSATEKPVKKMSVFDPPKTTKKRRKNTTFGNRFTTLVPHRPNSSEMFSAVKERFAEESKLASNLGKKNTELLFGGFRSTAVPGMLSRK